MTAQSLARSRRDLLPELEPVLTAPVSGRGRAWEMAIGLVTGLSLAVFGGIWALGSGPAAAEGNGCRVELVSCAALSGLAATGAVLAQK